MHKMNSTENNVGVLIPQVEDHVALQEFTQPEQQDEAPVVEEKQVIPQSAQEGDGGHTDPKTDPLQTELNLSEVKEQVLKEVEEMKDAEIPNLDSTHVSTVDIEQLLEPKEIPIANSKATEMEVEEPYDPNPQVNMEDMKAAQEELRILDILVCGACHQVVHFVEEFSKHKQLTCRGKSNFHGNIAETKSQVWAFLLWKNAQCKLNNRYGSSVTESSWKLYQKWCKMPDRIREAWVAAGETVMNFSTFGYNKSGESALKTPLKKPENKNDLQEINEDDEKKPVIMRKLVQRDHSGEIKEIRPAVTVNRKLNDDIENIRNQLEDGDSSQDKSVEMAKDGGEDTLREEEFVVEKIVSRRFNPRKKQYEYLLKWEGYPPEQNTWEPAENLEACQHLLKAFEDSLSKQSVTKQNKASGIASGRKPDFNQPGPSGLNTSYGRPVRYSKQKALNQVKAWCGSIKPDDAELETLKRRAPMTDSDDEEDGLIKRIKTEKETDSEDSLGGRVYYSKSGGMSGIIKRPGRGRGGYNRSRVPNGTATSDNLAAALGLESSGDEGEGKTKLSALEILNQKSLIKKVSSLSPANQQVLVANAKGVVKVDPSQVPNLSSGVYIMSNKSGIIKLDSVSPSKALSLKQGTVREMQTPSKPGSGSVVMLDKQNPTSIVQKTGIMRKNSLMAVATGRAPATTTVVNSPVPSVHRNLGRPSRPSGNIKITNPNTRLIHSGSGRSNTTINTSIRPRLPLKSGTDIQQKRSLEIERRGLGPKIGRGGGYGRGGFRGRGGITIGTNSISDTDSIGSKGKDKLMDGDNIFRDLNQDSQSSESDAGIPDDFPVDLPPIEPESPPRPLTLCPETGKVLLKAEGERTPEPTPPPSPSSIVIKQEEGEKPITQQPTPLQQEQPQHPQTKIQKMEEIKFEDSHQTYLSKMNSGKENNTIVKKTIGKPGSIGSVTISPKKILPDIEENESEFVTITGDDGLLYKVCKSELNNTLLLSGEDGQQCVYVTTGENGDDGGAVLALDPSYADTVAQLGEVNILGADGEEGTTQFYVKEGEEGELMSLEVQGQEGGDDSQSQLVAQLVEAGEPAPGGGPRRVVLLLPDGNLMMTEVDEEQYAALELDKFQTAAAEIE